MTESMDGDLSGAAFRRLLADGRHVPARDGDQPDPAFARDLLARLKGRLAERADGAGRAAGLPAGERPFAALLPLHAQRAHADPADPAAACRPEFRVGCYLRLRERLYARRAPAAIAPAAVVPAAFARPARPRAAWRSRMSPALAGAAVAAAATVFFAPAYRAGPGRDPSPGTTVPPLVAGEGGSLHIGPSNGESAAPSGDPPALTRLSPLEAAERSAAASGWRPLGELMSLFAPTSPTDGIPSYEPVGYRMPPRTVPAISAARAIELPRPPAADPDALAFFPASDLPAQLSVRRLEYRTAPGAAWADADTDALPAAPGLRLRVPDDADGGVRHGFRTADGRRRAVMLPGTEVAVTPDGFALERGCLMAFAAEDGPAFPLMVDGRPISLEPGGSLYAVAPDAAGFADGGAPAPVVRVERDSLAFMKGPTGVTPLFPCHQYRVDRYLNHDVTGFPVWALNLRLTPDPTDPAAAEFGHAPRRALAARRGYHLDKGEWRPSSYRDGQPVRTVKRLSREYLELLRRDRSLAPLLAMVDPMVVASDGQFYRIVD